MYSSDAQSEEGRTLPNRLCINTRAALWTERERSYRSAVGNFLVGLQDAAQELKLFIDDAYNNPVCGSRVGLAIRAMANRNSLGIHFCLIGDVIAQTTPVDFHIHTSSKYGEQALMVAILFLLRKRQPEQRIIYTLSLVRFKYE